MKPTLNLADRVFTCAVCGHAIDRDLNAAVTLATRGEQHQPSQVLDPEARGHVTNAYRQDSSSSRSREGETNPEDVGTLHHNSGIGTTEKRVANFLNRCCSTGLKARPETNVRWLFDLAGSWIKAPLWGKRFICVGLPPLSRVQQSKRR